MKSMIRKFVFSLMVMMLVCVSFMLGAFVAPAAAGDPYVIYHRVMGMAGTEEEFQETGEYKTIFAENVTVPMSYTVQCTSPSTGALGCKYSYHINESNHQIRYRHGPNCSQPEETYDMGEITGGTGGATSVLAALINASEQGNFTYGVTDAYIDMGQFVYAIAGQEDWCYRVWNPEGAHWAPCSCDNFLLGYDGIFPTPHTQVLWYHGGTGDLFPLKVDVSHESVAVGDEFTATVSYFEDGSGWLPAAGAMLNVSGETFTTDDNGTIKIFLENEDTYHLSAKKRRAEGTCYIGSDNRTTVNVSGGSGATWWTQTTKDNFSAGTCNQVNVSASPGNILLERGGTVTEDYILNGGSATLGGEHFYDEFKILNGATLYIPMEEPLKVHANYIEVDSTSSINADEKGYPGGAGDTGIQHDGRGMGCGSGGDYNSTTGEAGGGGGGGYGGKGRPGGSGSEAGVSGPAGATYGGSCYYGDHTFYRGSGGGAGAGDGAGSGGSGGVGGGAIKLEADTVIINGHISAKGGNGAQGASSCGSGGGGSGGTIYISGSDITIANGTLSVRGADGADASDKWSSGGGGGGGLIKVFYETCTESSGHDVSGGDSGVPYNRSASDGSGKEKSQWKQETYSPTLPYFTSGNLTSSIHDTGYSADFGKIYWCAAKPSNTSVKFQIATNNTWDFKGPDGTLNTYYETSGTPIWSGHDGDRYIKYKAFMSTTEVGKTPTVSKVGITYKEEGGELPVHNLDTGENFSTIQEAIDAANTADGHTITVDAGAYTENVDVITKSLTIRSTSGNPDDTIIQASDLTDHVFEVTTDYVNLSGFTVKGATGDGKAGIYLYSADHCVITNNTHIGNYYGIELIGFNCTVKDNTVRNNTMYGIYVFGNHSKICYNDLKYNDNYGLKMYNSFGNCIYGNAFISNNIDHPEHTSQAYDNGDNYWRSTVKLGYYNDSGVPFDNYVGNYWSDYTGVDSDGDGIGDTAYQIDG